MFNKPSTSKAAPASPSTRVLPLVLLDSLISAGPAVGSASALTTSTQGPLTFLHFQRMLPCHQAAQVSSAGRLAHSRNRN